jgi:hypothetical protein
VYKTADRPDGIYNHKTLPAMFYNFNAHRGRKPRPRHDQALARKIFRNLIGLQQRWAHYMQTQSSRLSFRWITAISVTVLIVSCAYSILLITEGLLSLSTFRENPVANPWLFEPGRSPQKDSSKYFYRVSPQVDAPADSLEMLNPNP